MKSENIKESLTKKNNTYNEEKEEKTEEYDDKDEEDNKNYQNNIFNNNNNNFLPNFQEGNFFNNNFINNNICQNINNTNTNYLFNPNNKNSNLFQLYLQNLVQQKYNEFNNFGIKAGIDFKNLASNLNLPLDEDSKIIYILTLEFMDKNQWLLYDKDGFKIKNFNSLELFKYLTFKILANNIPLNNYVIFAEDTDLSYRGGKLYMSLINVFPFVLEKRKENYIQNINSISQMNNNFGINNFGNNLGNNNINFPYNLDLNNLNMGNLNNLNNLNNLINLNNNMNNLNTGILGMNNLNLANLNNNMIMNNLNIGNLNNNMNNLNNRNINNNNINENNNNKINNINNDKQ